MVHRNTEYKIKFYFPSKELSKKIWLDNIRDRESRRTMNLADHYWGFQTSNETCDCEDSLAARSKCDGVVLKKSDEEIIDKNTTSKSNEIEKELNHASAHVVSHREADTQTPKWIPTRSKELSLSGNLPAKKKDIPKPEKEKRLMVVKRNEDLPLMRKHSSRRSASTAVASQNLESRKVQSDHEAHRHFLPYGWNNDTKNIGSKKTFNVSAPEKEVHHTAIMAMRRKTELDPFYLSQYEKIRQKSASLLSLPRVNHSSIWMTEYQDKFTKGFMTSR